MPPEPEPSDPIYLDTGFLGIETEEQFDLLLAEERGEIAMTTGGAE